MKNEVVEMAEDTLVRMLLEVAGGAVADERDVELTRAAARWAHDVAGWRLHLHNGFVFERNGMCFWVLANRPDQVLEIRISSDMRFRWTTHARHRIAHLGHGLDVLAAEDLLPARFSTIGRKALDDYAEALDRAASRLAAMGDEAGPAELAEYGEHYPWEMRLRAAVMNRAADQARAFPRAELAVMV